MKSHEYYDVVSQQLRKQFDDEADSIQQSAQHCAQSVLDDRVIHVFGCGHSQIFAMEVFYRAGGLVPVNALLTPHLALFPKAKLSTYQERLEGFSQEYLALEDTDPRDTMIIVSISGRNPAGVDMALAAQEIGMKVVALVSEEFASSTTSRHSSGKNLKDVADVVVDIKCVSGDAVLSADGLEGRFCGTSTVLGVTVIESIIAQTVQNCVDAGTIPPIYVSANLDKGDAINAAHIAKYSHMISGL
ncbi:sugar isomerase domain-containing protein [Paramicrobacterium chengjingii]|uniref:SIS domain-containing protein n=1 Tax=Paramicrobacterium chengjingii TaxID=2769067 RepID=A0ABX6YHE4_9MICO|nr:SIS domain-containing protein [Microbacterium chengjingii]QPZ38181.1 SIS domain-containing protein [Microbacterium chengjingii]